MVKRCNIFLVGQEKAAFCKECTFSGGICSLSKAVIVLHLSLPLIVLYCISFHSSAYFFSFDSFDVSIFASAVSYGEIGVASASARRSLVRTVDCGEFQYPARSMGISKRAFLFSAPSFT